MTLKVFSANETVVYNFLDGTISSGSFVPGILSAKEYGETPNFRKRRTTSKARARPFIEQMNEYAHTQWVFRRGRHWVKVRVSPTQPWVDLYGCFGHYGPVLSSAKALPTAEHNELYSKAVSKLPSKMNGSQFNLPLFLAEAHKSVEMVRNAAHDIAKILRKARTNREMEGLWLEYRYGWRLLVKDIYDGLVAIHDARTRGIVERVKSSSRRSYAWKQTIADFNYGRIGMENFRADMLVDHSLTCETSITLYYRDPYGPTLGTLQQFGITNPLALAWEVIPYSFVLDWFLPVGEYLSSLDAFLGKEFVSGCVSYIYEWNRDFNPTNIRDYWTPAQRELQAIGKSPSVLRERYYRRTPLTNFPAMSLPSIQINLNSSRATDAIALLQQRRR